MAIPGIVCQLSTGNPPYLLPGDGASWQDISKYVLAFEFTRGKTRIIDRFEPGTLNLRLKNTDRRFDPTNTAGPYYPYLLPMRPIRFGFVVGGVTKWVYTGYVERWPQIWKGPTWAEVDLVAVDGFEFLSTHFISSAYATLVVGTAPFSTSTFTSATIGFVGNSTTVASVVAGTNTPLTISVVGTAVTINCATGPGGGNESTVPEVQAAIAADPAASALVIYTGNPVFFGMPAFAATALTGGTFLQALSGVRVGEVLDFISFPTGSSYRSLSTGSIEVQAQAFPPTGDNQALGHLYGVEQTEDGALFLDRNGRVTFIGHNELLIITQGAPVATLADKPSANVGTFPYQEGTQGHWDLDLIYNRIISNRLNASSGNVQTSTDATSDAEYFTRSLSISPLSISNDASQDLSGALLLRYAQPKFYFDKLTCMPGSDTSFWAMLTSLELMQAVKVLRHPPGAGPELVVQGPLISIEASGDRSVQDTVWKIQVAPGLGTNFFILDDPIYGVLDAGNGLGY